MSYRIGIDIGGTKCTVLLGRAENEQNRIAILEKTLFETKKTSGPQEMIGLFMRAIDALIEKYASSKEEFAGIGISCGGPLDSRGRVILAPPNLPGWLNIPIGKMLEERYHLPVTLENDANACALAEWKYGAGRGCQSLIFLTFGTGCGAGLILDGRLYRGISDMAGEIGHLRLAECGPVGFGKMGSFEGFCSGGGIHQLAKMMVSERLGMGESPALLQRAGSMENLSAKLVAEAAKEGDVLAKEIFAVSGRYLGKGLSLLIDILNPERVIIGSIFERSRELLWPAAEEVIKRECIPISQRVCEVLPARLGDAIGDYAALSLAGKEE